jgi:hypothetical protein
MYTHKTSGFKTSGFKTSGFKTSGLQNVSFTKRQVSKSMVLKRSVFKFDIRGVLGNKCAGHYNLKTVHFRETLASDNFLVCSSAIRVFFSALYLPQDSWGKLLCNDGGGDPL